MSPTEAQKAEASSGAQVFVGDILDAPFSPLSFDVITCFHVLEHVYRPKDVVRTLWEWLRPGGILYREGIAKISQFSRSCNDDGIPIVWLHDISGFDIGPEAERQGLLGYGSTS